MKMFAFTLTFVIAVSSIAAAFSVPPQIPFFPTKSSNGTEKAIIAFGGSAYGPGDGAYRDVEIISLATKKHRNGTTAVGVLELRGVVHIDDAVYIVGLAYYNITTNKWAVDFPPNYPHSIGSQVAVALNYTIITLGGTTEEFSYETDIFAYKRLDQDGQPGRWKFMGKVPAQSQLACAVVVKNSIYYMAGLELHRSDDSGKSWTKLKNLGNNCGQVRVACAAIDDNTILMSGGRASGDPPSTTDATCIYNIVQNSWKSDAPRMMSEREGHTAVLLPSDSSNAKVKNVLVCGGFQGNDDSVSSEASSSCEVYDTKSGKWKAAPFAMNHGRSLFGLVVADVPKQN